MGVAHPIASILYAKDLDFSSNIIDCFVSNLLYVFMPSIKESSNHVFIDSATMLG